MASWIAFQGYGGAWSLGAVTEKEAVAAGFHVYATQAQAEKNPNSVNFLQTPIADQIIAQASGVSTAPGQNTGSANAPNPLSGLAAIGDFFSRLTEASTWLRVGEGILGLILIAAGIARLTHAVPVATKIAKAVA